MMIRLRLFGREIYCFEATWDQEPAEDDDDLPITKDDVEKMVDQIKGKKDIGGGQSLECDRDTNAPAYPGSPMEYEDWKDAPFGFRKPQK